MAVKSGRKGGLRLADRAPRRSNFQARALAAGLLMLCGGLSGGAAAQEPRPIGIAAALSITGLGAGFGVPTRDGLQLAIDEANAAGGTPIVLTVHDDGSDEDRAAELAAGIADTGAVLVVGPTFSTTSLAAGPVYAEAGLASLPPTATSDLITRSGTTFRLLFRNSEQGEAIALYLKTILGQERAAVIFVRNGYGNSLKAGFERAAGRLGIEADFYPFVTAAEADAAARTVARLETASPVVLLTLDTEGAAIVATLRRLGVARPIIGSDSFSSDHFPSFFTDEPEELFDHGYFTDGIYAVSPLILDSANAETLDLAERYRARTGRDFTWMAAAGYEAGRLAAAAVRAAARNAKGSADTAALREGVLDFLGHLDSPKRSLAGLLGPIAFDRRRGRSVGVRIGQYRDDVLESALLQVVPVPVPEPDEIDTGAVFETAPGRYGRLQQVVHTGMYINEIRGVDPARAQFGADFYLWLRYAPARDADGADPAEIDFPSMLSGDFVPSGPAEERTLADGTEYRLWRVQGEFRNDFDLRDYPFDRQVVKIPFFHARAASDRIVYAVDRRAQASANALAFPSPPGAAIAAESGEAPAVIAADEAFRNLTQWRRTRVSERRENLVTTSLLGDPRRLGVHGGRELSGYVATVELQRRAESILKKTMIPLLLMTLIMYAALYFPPAMLKEKVMVSVTGALSGAVLLSSIHAQLGGVGYTVALEYAFYVFFFLSLFNIIVVLIGERFRHAGHERRGDVTDLSAQTAYVGIVMATVIAAWAFWLHSGG